MATPRRSAPKQVAECTKHADMHHIGAQPVLVFSDLDGTLLDHDSYSHAAADARLAELRQRSIPLIPCTSKTRAELLALRTALGSAHPFIVENGAAVFIPDGYFSRKPAGCRVVEGFWVREFTQPRSHWLALLAEQATDYGQAFEHFYQLGPEGIARLTGLDPVAADLANQREYGEPIAWLGSDSQRRAFIATLEGQGAQLLQGGRFLHLSGACDKGQALTWLTRQYDLARQTSHLSIAAGDSGNDIAMLEAADWSLIVRSPAHPPPTLQKRDRVLVSSQPGPAGWSEGLAQIFHRLHRQDGTRDS